MPHVYYNPTPRRVLFSLTADLGRLIVINAAMFIVFDIARSITAIYTAAICITATTARFQSPTTLL